MKIAILGAGAMGSMYGGYLSKNNEVSMVDVWKDHVDAINAKGLIIDEPDGTSVVVHPKAYATADAVGVVDLVVVFVKSIQTLDALKNNMALIGPKTMVLSLQNGYGNAEDMMEYVEKKRVIVGTTSHGCTIKGPGHVFHAGKGPTHIGAMDTDQTHAHEVAQVLEQAGFEADVSDNVLQLVWGKLFINVGINAVCTLLQTTNIAISDNPSAKEIARGLVYEAVAVANATGQQFDAETVFQDTCEIAVKTGSNHCSMLADYEKKRQTEIMKMNGIVAKKADELQVDAPLNRQITQLICALEHTYLA